MSRKTRLKFCLPLENCDLIFFGQILEISASVGSEKQLAAWVENGRGKFIMVVEVDIAE